MNLIATNFCIKIEELTANYNYRTSAYLSHEMLYASGDIDYLIYPAVEEDMSINVAFHPRVLQNGFLKFKNAYLIEATKNISTFDQKIYPILRNIKQILCTKDGENLEEVDAVEAERLAKRLHQLLHSISQ